MYHLYAFTDSNVTVITRGLTERKALAHVAQSGVFPRGVGVYPVGWLPVDAPDRYLEADHDFDWFHVAPQYENKCT